METVLSVPSVQYMYERVQENRKIITKHGKCYLPKSGCLLQNLHFPLTTATGMVGVPLALDHYHYVLQLCEQTCMEYVS